MTKNILRVRNVEQAAIWLELDGQLSDGHWENARPLDHWKPWCDAEVVVDRNNVGRNFYARKTNYNFSDKALLDVVGKRMLGIVRIAREVGLKAAEILEFAVDCETGTIDWKASWNADRIAKLAELNVATDSVDIALANDAYDFSDMRRDLNDLKEIIRTWSNEVASAATQAVL